MSCNLGLLVMEKMLLQICFQPVVSILIVKSFSQSVVGTDMVESLVEQISLYNFDSGFWDVDILRRSFTNGGGCKLLCVSF